MRSLKHKIFDWVMPRLSFNAREQMFRDIGQTLGVRSFSVDGELGLIEGHIKDQTVHGYYLRNRTWAPWLQEVLREVIFRENCGTFVDIGANIGLTVVPIAKSKDIKCIAFEPEKMNYSLLRKNIASCRLEGRIETHNLALFSSDSELEFELSEDNMGDHRVRAKGDTTENQYGEASRKTTKVQARKLDGIIKTDELRRPVAVKLDVQGSEVKVFEGGREFFKNIDFLFVEFWPYGLKRMGDRPEAFIEFIRQFPWAAVYNDTSKISGSGLNPIKDIIDVLNEKITAADNGHLDVLFSRYQI